jgi:hypothetical protein
MDDPRQPVMKPGLKFDETFALRFVHSRATIYYSNYSSYTDTGKIVYLDNNWLELLKDNGEQLVIPVAAVRIIKLLEATDKSYEATTLLRPSGPETTAGS